MVFEQQKEKLIINPINHKNIKVKFIS